MNSIRMTPTGFVAKGTGSDFPRFADLEIYMEHPPCRNIAAPHPLAPWLRQVLDDLGTGLAIAGLCAAAQCILVLA